MTLLRSVDLPELRPLRVAPPKPADTGKFPPIPQLVVRRMGFGPATVFFIC